MSGENLPARAIPDEKPETLIATPIADILAVGASFLDKFKGFPEGGILSKEQKNALVAMKPAVLEKSALTDIRTRENIAMKKGRSAEFIRDIKAAVTDAAKTVTDKALEMKQRLDHYAYVCACNALVCRFDPFDAKGEIPATPWYLAALENYSPGVGAKLLPIRERVKGFLRAMNGVTVPARMPQEALAVIAKTVLRLQDEILPKFQKGADNYYTQESGRILSAGKAKMEVRGFLANIRTDAFVSKAVRIDLADKLTKVEPAEVRPKVAPNDQEFLTARKDPKNAEYALRLEAAEKDFREAIQKPQSGTSEAEAQVAWGKLEYARALFANKIGVKELPHYAMPRDGSMIGRELASPIVRAQAELDKTLTPYSEKAFLAAQKDPKNAEFEASRKKAEEAYLHYVRTPVLDFAATGAPENMHDPYNFHGNEALGLWSKYQDAQEVFARNIKMVPPPRYDMPMDGSIKSTVVLKPAEGFVPYNRENAMMTLQQPANIYPRSMMNLAWMKFAETRENGSGGNEKLWKEFLTAQSKALSMIGMAAPVNEPMPKPDQDKHFIIPDFIGPPAPGVAETISRVGGKRVASSKSPRKG